MINHHQIIQTIWVFCLCLTFLHPNLEAAGKKAPRESGESSEFLQRTLGQKHPVPKELSPLDLKKAQRMNAAHAAWRTFEIGSFKYGMSLHHFKDAKDRFSHFSFGPKTNGKIAPGGTIILSAQELAVFNPPKPGSMDDYTYSMLRSRRDYHKPILGRGKTLKGHIAFYSKRHATNDRNAYIPVKQLFRFSFEYEVDRQSGKLLAIKKRRVGISFPFGYTNGDIGSLRDKETHYIISAATSEGSINCYRLSEDLSDVEKLVFSMHEESKKDHREAPCLFKANGMFYMTTSGKTGWAPNQQKYTYAPSIEGPWSENLPYGDLTAFHGQAFGTGQGQLKDGTPIGIFNGTRNAPLWGGENNKLVPGIRGSYPKLKLPIYFNTPEKLGLSYYNDIKWDGRTLIYAGQRPEGRRLEIMKVEHSGGAPGLDKLTDGGLVEQWEYRGKPKTSLTFTLKNPEVIKVIKVCNPVNGDPLEHRSHTRSISAMKIELGDENGMFAEISNEWILQFSWLQSLPLSKKNQRKAKYIRFTHQGTLRNAKALLPLWAFREVEIWGGRAKPKSFEALNGSIQKRFEARTGTALTFSAQLNHRKVSKTNTTIHILALDKGSEQAEEVAICELALKKNSKSLEVSFKENPRDTQFMPLRKLSKDALLEVVINTDSRTYDILIDGKMVWSAARLLAPQRFISRIDVKDHHQSQKTFPRAMSFGPSRTSDN